MTRSGVPVAVRVLAAGAVALLVLPLVGLVLRAPWARATELLGERVVLDALRLSLACSFAALGLATVLGVPLAWVLARAEFRGKTLLRALTVLPMVLPPVVGGAALLLAFGRRGLIGQPVDALTGFSLPFTLWGVVVAEAFVSMPFLVVTVEAGLRALDRRYEDAAATLGAARGLTFRRITLPLVLPSVGAGMALCWVRALGEFGATITFAGNFPGRTQTMPLAVYLQLESDPGAAFLTSLLLLAMSVAVLAALRGRYLGTA